MSSAGPRLEPADPKRLDVDWRYLDRARELGVTIEIGPDAQTLTIVASYGPDPKAIEFVHAAIREAIPVELEQDNKLFVVTIERVRRAFNPTLEILGVVLTMFDKRNNLSEMVAADDEE